MQPDGVQETRGYSPKIALSATSDIRTLVDIAYAYHYHLFTEHVSKDDNDTTVYSSALRSGMSLLFS
jgi:hypothetical protein